MATWTTISENYLRLAEACHAGAPMAEAWRAFAESVREAEATAPPFHYRTLVRLVARARGDRPGGEVTILEHGCGGCLSALYLLALGYEGVHGIDVGGDCEDWNRLMREQFGIETKRFFLYDGRRIPLPDRSVDFVFSQQVLEHVSPSAIDAYYREEGRILKPGGLAYHEVPHRLVPYDSHSRTWFVHYLPSSLHGPAYRLLGRDPALLREMLHLRWPGYHRRQVRRHIGPVEDLTLARLTVAVDPGNYDGSVRLRNMIRRLAGAPVLGAVAGAVLRHLVMLETVAVRR